MLSKTIYMFLKTQRLVCPIVSVGMTGIHDKKYTSNLPQKHSHTPLEVIDSFLDSNTFPIFV